MKLPRSRSLFPGLGLTWRAPEPLLLQENVINFLHQYFNFWKSFYDFFDNKIANLKRSCKLRRNPRGFWVFCRCCPGLCSGRVRKLRQSIQFPIPLRLQKISIWWWINCSERKLVWKKSATRLQDTHYRSWSVRITKKYSNWMLRIQQVFQLEMVWAGGDK